MPRKINTSKHLSEEHKKKISESMTGKYIGKNHPMYGKIGAFYGKHHSQQARIKISEALKGKYIGEKASNYGRRFSQEHRNKISEALKGKNNGSWRGDDVGYRQLHKWVGSRLPKQKLCQMCHKVQPYDLANITGVYDRDFKNWAYLCRSCHGIYDGTAYRSLHKLNKP